MFDEEFDEDFVDELKRKKGVSRKRKEAKLHRKRSQDIKKIAKPKETDERERLISDYYQRIVEEELKDEQ